MRLFCLDKVLSTSGMSLFLEYFIEIKINDAIGEVRN